MAVFFIRALKTLCDRNKLSLSRFRIPAASSIGLPVFGSPQTEKLARLAKWNLKPKQSAHQFREYSGNYIIQIYFT